MMISLTVVNRGKTDSATLCRVSHTIHRQKLGFRVLLKKFSTQRFLIQIRTNENKRNPNPNEFFVLVTVIIFSLICSMIINIETDKAQNFEKFVAGNDNKFLSNAIFSIQ